MTTPQHPLEGTVKWFDHNKGYGFIVPTDNSLPEIMLHANALRRSDFAAEVVPEGATVVTKVETGPNGGWRASEIISLDISTGTNPGQRARTHVKVQATGDFEPAEVKWYNGLRGFGFLTRGLDTEDIFVHAETLKAFDIPDLEPGEKVLVRFGQSPKGLMAVELKPVY